MDYSTKKLAELREMAAARGTLNTTRMTKAQLREELARLDAELEDPADYGDLPEDVEHAPDEPEPVEDEYQPPTKPPSPPPIHPPEEELGPEPDPPMAYQLTNDITVINNGVPSQLKAGRILWDHIDDIEKVKAAKGVVHHRLDLRFEDEGKCH
jgi:hypothetical protein